MAGEPDLHLVPEQGASCEVRVLQALRRIIRAVDIYSRNINARFGVTVPQIICLHSLQSRERMTLSELAGQMNLSTSTVNGIVDRLELKGLIQRQRSRQDRRKVYVELLEPGRQLIRSAPPLLQGRLSQALPRLSGSEQAAIASALERVVELMEVEHLDASPNLMPHADLSETNKE